PGEHEAVDTEPDARRHEGQVAEQQVPAANRQHDAALTEVDSGGPMRETRGRVRLIGSKKSGGKAPHSKNDDRSAKSSLAPASGATNLTARPSPGPFAALPSRRRRRSCLPLPLRAG